jgi:hypothetical protein
VAPTADDHSAEWLLLRDALALVAERCKSQVEAQEFLLDHLQEGRIHWRYRKKSGHWPQMRDWGDEPGTPDWRFWHTTPGATHLEIDWENSSATRTGPAPHSPNWPPLVGPEPLENFKLSLVRLSRPDTLAALRSVFGQDTPAPAPVAVLASVAPPERKLDPKVWLAKVRKDHPQRQDERPGEYRNRLHGMMQSAPVTRTWTLETLRRRLYDKDT